MFVTHSTQTCGAQHETSADRSFESKPPSGENSQEVPTGKNEHVVVDRPQALDDAVGSHAHIGRRFTSRASIMEQLPIRTLLMNVRRAATFVVAIVPFHQVPVDFDPIAKAGQFAGPG